MGKFAEDAKLLLKYVGGKENIKAITHCVTRMRFVLIDTKKADVKAIENLKSTKGTFTQSGQFQVIIGNEVSEYYNEFVKISGIEGVSKDAVKESAKGNQTFLQRLMSNIAEIFSPLIPAIICGGFILGFRSIISDIKFFEEGTKSLTQISQFWSGTNDFLWLIGEAIFHYLPVGITWSITKKMGTTQILGIVLGITLVSPQLVNAYLVGTVDPKFYDFGFFKMPMVGYQAQVIPAIMAGFVLVYLEKFWRKVVPEYISMVIIPFASLIPTVIIAHAVVGPIGWKIGEAVSYVVYNGLTSKFGVLFAGVFGFFYAPLVITGLHHMSNAIDLQLMSQFGGTMLWPMIALSNIAQGSAVVAMAILQKKNNKAKQINIPAFISCYLGVTEPALFGVNLKYGFPFICALIGSCIAAVISVGSKVMATSIGIGGIPGILSIQPRHMLMFAVAMIFAIAIPLILTLIVGKKKLKAEDLIDNIDNNTEDAKNSNTSDNLTILDDDNFVSPMSGKVYKLSSIADEAFSSGAMGEGFAVELYDGKVTSPCDGEITAAFPTKHAYGIETKDGKEILIHIGMDTVELKGEGFEAFVKAGDKVKKGDIIAKVDLEYVKNHGKSLVSPVVFTDGSKINLLKENAIIKNGEGKIIEIK
ncbi:PTS system trehalose-specific EIIBC component [Brachyspira innocens]|uniref:PTS system trehalose-specific EIIBC component n=1 Tax=Brachyspira innocens TaxID=13264 RepID=UPI0003764053|nr:PTS system trehalose-specific EIIBC component [Brachyspira innocens]